jgi:hypothetical protein
VYLCTRDLTTTAYTHPSLPIQKHYLIRVFVLCITGITAYMLCITGELYPAPKWAEAFAGAARALQLGGMVLMFAGDLLFNTLHLPQPFFYNWIAVCIDSTSTTT